MEQSLQKDLPAARVNITLDLETSGASQKKELPCKLLAMGDFSGGNNSTPLNQRQRHKITKNNFDQVMKELHPQINLNLPNKLKSDPSELHIDLEFEKLKDFHPDEIIMKVPVLRKLLAMRNLLRDFKSNLMDSKTLQQELQKIMADPYKIKQLQNELASLQGRATS